MQSALATRAEFIFKLFVPLPYWFKTSSCNDKYLPTTETVLVSAQSDPSLSGPVRARARAVSARASSHL